jgi:putative NADH-flavin reductase
VKLTVFGAAGRTGRQVLVQSSARGHELTAFVRDASRFEAPSGVRVVEGDARDPATVVKSVGGADGVVSVLALMSAGDEPQYSEATRTIAEACEGMHVARLVVTANNDVFGDDEVTGEFAAHAREHRRNRATLRASSLEWTIGAAPLVTDDPGIGAYEAVIDGKAPGGRLTAADFATFTLDALERDVWIGHIVGVSSP